MNKEETKMTPLEIDAIVKTLRYLSINKSISDEKGKDLTGGFWSFVKQELKKHRCFTLSFGGVQIVIQSDFEYLLAKYEESSKITETEEQEKEIAVEADISTTKSYRVALAALFLSLISILISIYTLIYK